jgi:hypothetical protein
MFADATIEFIGAEIEQLVYDTISRIKMADAESVLTIGDLIETAAKFKTLFKRNTAGLLSIRNRLDQVADRTNSGSYGVLMTRTDDAMYG